MQLRKGFPSLTLVKLIKFYFKFNRNISYQGYSKSTK